VSFALFLVILIGVIVTSGRFFSYIPLLATATELVGVVKTSVPIDAKVNRHDMLESLLPLLLPPRVRVVFVFTLFTSSPLNLIFVS
jgi:hypothetical protein